MKANEAPENIYLPYKDDRLIGIVKTEGVKFNSGVDGHIEYIRKDAFIEKAVSYIQQHWIWNNKIIEDFKNYMEGK